MLDSSGLLIAFFNLIENAIKYSFIPSKFSRYKPITINGKYKSCENIKYYSITIINYGETIRPDENEKIFEQYTRGSNNNKINTQGLGLGLYLCKIIFKN